jgi:hypothetical protein
VINHFDLKPRAWSDKISNLIADEVRGELKGSRIFLFARSTPIHDQKIIRLTLNNHQNTPFVKLQSQPDFNCVFSSLFFSIFMLECKE